MSQLSKKFSTSFIKYLIPLVISILTLVPDYFAIVLHKQNKNIAFACTIDEMKKLASDTIKQDTILYSIVLTNNGENALESKELEIKLENTDARFVDCAFVERNYTLFHDTTARIKTISGENIVLHIGFFSNSIPLTLQVKTIGSIKKRSVLIVCNENNFSYMIMGSLKQRLPLYLILLSLIPIILFIYFRFYYKGRRSLDDNLQEYYDSK